MFGLEMLPHTPLNICQDILGLVIALAFGLFVCARLIGGWGSAGVFVMGVLLGIKFCPGNEAVVVFIIAGVEAGVVVRIFSITPRGFQRSARASVGSAGAFQFAGGLGETVGGFEDVETAADDDLFGAGQAGENQAPPPAVPAKDYYDVLGVDRGASDDELKRAYHRLIKTCHPDLFPGDKEKEERAKEINEAYDVLCDDQKRAAYDHYGYV